MPTRAEIIEAGAGAVAALEWGSSNGGVDPTDDQIAEAALSAMLPLIKAQMVAQVRGGCVREVVAVHESHGEEAWCLEHKEHWPCANEAAARIIEEYEL